MSAAQVNLWLALAVSGAVLTGLVSWAVGTEWSRFWTALHGVLGVLVLVLAPAKARGSIKTGMRRGRPSRWLSLAFGLLILSTVALGFAHSTGAWTGVGYWTSLWTHFLFAFLAIPLLAWHIAARPARPRRVDFDRRMLLRGGAAAGVAAGVAAVPVGFQGAGRRAAVGWGGAGVVTGLGGPDDAVAAGLAFGIAADGALAIAAGVAGQLGGAAVAGAAAIEVRLVTVLYAVGALGCAGEIWITWVVAREIGDVLGAGCHKHRGHCGKRAGSSH